MFRVYNFREPVYQEPRAAGVSYDSCLRFLPEVEDPRKEEPSLLYPFLKEKNQEHGYPLSRSPIFYLNPPSIESQSISVRSPTSFSFESRFSHAISCRKMSCEFETAPPTLRIVTISYSELQDKDGNLSMKIENGFGPDGLGIISISDVPGFPLLRQILLHLSPRLASLPEEAKKELEDPDSRYGFGWSHGKQMLEAGKLGLLYEEDYWRGPWCGGLYFLHSGELSARSDASLSSFTFVSHCFESSQESAALWHGRLGHVSFKTLQFFLPKFNKLNNVSFQCETCQFSKHAQTSFPTLPHCFNKTFALIHYDIWGPSLDTSIDVFSYFVTFINGFSRVTCVYLMKWRHELPRLFKSFHQLIMTQYDYNI
ncbi:uncharacterized protein LOC131254869 isoform X5 [Magnolia sinica]|uniref:uncharacterized protein LOC131254869 isoform X5 n=1 Tax=Magnolia sinica TaxID=86752 RepID=UPI0026595482|nr:uncharacterized protein LOC131254869 isoform X5 [Magnolia sinica]